MIERGTGQLKFGKNFYEGRMKITNRQIKILLHKISHIPYPEFCRRHNSRASSVDRREIFEKYVHEGNEHSNKILPYSNDDPELIGNENDFGETSNNLSKSVTSEENQAHTTQALPLRNSEPLLQEPSILGNLIKSNPLQFTNAKKMSRNESKQQQVSSLIFLEFFDSSNNS